MASSEIFDMIIKIFLVVATIGFITILVIKRFWYFQPSKEFMYPQIKYEDIFEGNIHAWFVNGTNNNVILFCHGNAGNLTYRQDKIQALNKLGYSVLIFDYAGFGRSQGVPNEQTCYHNACMYLEFLSRKFPKENIILYGESLGAAIAAFVSRRYQIKRLVIESGLPSVKALFKTYVPFLSFLSFIFPEFDTESYLRNHKGNVLVLHCLNDEVIPYNITESLRKVATKAVNMTGSHNAPNIPWNTVDEFLKFP